MSLSHSGICAVRGTPPRLDTRCPNLGLPPRRRDVRRLGHDHDVEGAALGRALACCRCEPIEAAYRWKWRANAAPGGFLTIGAGGLLNNHTKRDVMNRTVTFAIATLIFGAVWTGASLAQTAKDFVGTWTLVAVTTEQGGVKSDTFGPDAKGRLMFDAGVVGQFELLASSSTGIICGARIRRSAGEHPMRQSLRPLASRSDVPICYD
jgi:hypothetical protein